ncbi:endo-1,4-beta-xylanase [Leptolyngbya sp. NIES-3755]|nr:endo-1,4-beta-xylanase [Leptolyngbya sp. NIES-3755]
MNPDKTVQRKKHKKIVSRRSRKPGKRLTRRKFLLLGLGALVGIGGTASFVRADELLFYIRSLVRPPRDFSVVGKQSLRERATAKGLIYGSSLHRRALGSDPEYGKQIAQECGMLVPEWELKWRSLRPSPDRFDFSGADALLNFAQQHQMQFRGHTLVWHQANPTWLRETITRRNAEKLLVDHVQTVVKHYAGKIHSWDVVNEAIRPGDGQQNGMRQTLWLQSLGEQYIDIAFRTAAAADPNAMLVYNDVNLEDASREQETRRQAVLGLLSRMKSRGTPIHALGIQGHWAAWQDRFDPNRYREFLREIASMGLKIMITEMDITDRRLPGDIPTRDRIVAGMYEDYLSVVLDEPAVIGVLTWGLSDKYSWLSDYAPRRDRKPVRPLPLDDRMQRKLAWNAVARSFDRTFAR